MPITLALYVLRELGKATAMSLLVFLFILLGVQTGVLVSDGVSLWTAIWTIPYMVPIVSPQVLPLAIMTGILIGYGRLAAGNEFIAAQAGGIRPFWLGAPSIVMAALAVFVTVFLNEFALGPSMAAIRQAYISDYVGIMRHQLSRPGSLTHEMEKGKFISVCLLPRDPGDGGRPIEITEFHYGSPPGEGDPADPSGARPPLAAGGEPLWDSSAPWPVRHVVARGHEIDNLERTPDGRMQLGIHFDRPLVYLYTKANLVDTEAFSTGSGRQTMEFGRSGRMRISDTRPTYWSILRLLASRREAIRISAEYNAGLREILQGGEANPEAAQMREKAGELEEQVRIYTAHLNMKIALCFSCFAFALLGAPMGLSLKRGSPAIGFATGTAVAVAYFGLVHTFRSLVENGTVEWWSLWIPNAAMVVLSLVYWLRFNRAS